MKANHHPNPNIKVKTVYPSRSEFRPFHNYLLVRKVDPPRTGDTVQDGIIIPHNIDDGSTTEVVEVVSVSDQLIRELEKWAHPSRFPFAIGSHCLIQKGLNMLPVELKGEKLFIVSYEGLVGMLK